MLRRVCVLTLSLVMLMAVTFICGYLLLQYNHNFSSVIPKQVFRSSQMNALTLTKTIQNNNIKSVLNLRGFNPDKDWYQNEIVVSNRLGVTHYDYGLSAGKVLSLAQMNELISLINEAPKPLLIHCNGGSDRTGLVSAIYLLHRGWPENMARQQLSIRYGHVPLMKNETSAMDTSFDNYLISRNKLVIH